MKHLLLIAVIFLSACSRSFEVEVPDLNWDLFNNSNAARLDSLTVSKMDGVYNLASGSDFFGALAAGKFSYTIKGADTSFYFSIFFEKDAAYILCEGKRLDSAILLNGYWRQQKTSETGRVRLNITKENGGDHLLSDSALRPTDKIVITGSFGRGNGVPDRPIQLSYARKLFKNNPFYIIAHRGGGRTSDRLPHSENTLEVLRLAPRLGANAVEIDVRLTKDGVPVLYHDVTLNERLTEKNGLLGPIENYTYEQLNALVRLVNGERIPTLDQALRTIMDETPMEFVWLDIKYEGPLPAVRAIQQQYLQEAAFRKRKLEIVVGIFNDEILGFFKQLPNYRQIPSLVELSTQVTRDVNARVWAPQWTGGLQTAEVNAMKAEGRQTVSWTLDVAENIKKYLSEGRYDGITTNFPTLLAYYYYVQP